MLLSRILGWSPPDNEEYLNVTVASGTLLPLQNPAFYISDLNPIRETCQATSEKFESASPASSTSALSTDSEFPDEKRVESNGKHADPSWVARPRNEFILFRCDYVRKHSREGKRVRRAPGPVAEKTLSKQAAEAWHHLPPEERLYWKERAKGERNEHARRHPDYRYRPKKNAPGWKRQRRNSPSKRVGSLDNCSGAGIVSTSRPESSSSPVTRESSFTDLTAKKAQHRRSSSVPEVTVTDPVNRRLHSTTSHSWITTSGPPSTADGLAFGPPPGKFTLPFRLQDAPSPVSGDYPATPTSGRVMHSTSSSILNWNREHVVSAPPQPTQFLSSTSAPSRFGIDNANCLSLTGFTSGGNPTQPCELFTMDNAMNHSQYRPSSDIWMPQLSNYSGVDSMPETIEANGIQAQGDSAVPHKKSSTMVYDSEGRFQIPDLVGYGLNSSECVPNDMLEGRPVSSEALFSMEVDELFNPGY